MPWSKSGVLKKDLAQKSVLEFIPQKFELGTPSQAMEYLGEKKAGSDFRMSDVLRVQTGVDKIEESEAQKTIEEKAIEKLKEIQEAAYKEAYQLGLDEGRKKAFDDNSKIIGDHMNNFEQTLNSFANMKKEMFNANESHLMQLLFSMATKIAQRQMDLDPQSVVDVIRNAVALAQGEEEIRVQLSQSQYEFIESLKKEIGREFDFLKKLKLEPNAEIQAGGCLVETNFGEVDARVEQRVALLWESLQDILPRVKTKLESAS